MTGRILKGRRRCGEKELAANGGDRRRLQRYTHTHTRHTSAVCNETENSRNPQQIFKSRCPDESKINLSRNCWRKLISRASTPATHTHHWKCQCQNLLTLFLSFPFFAPRRRNVYKRIIAFLCRSPSDSFGRLNEPTQKSINERRVNESWRKFTKRRDNINRSQGV